MQFWEKEYVFVRLLSHEKATRFGISSLLQHKKSGELVVLKSVSIANKIGLQQLENESKFHFNTEGLPQILTTHIDEFNYSILKNYAEGQTLVAFWKTVKKRRRLTRLKEILAALDVPFAKLHQLGIVHGDIKPENILVHTVENKLHCSLIDFGLAFYPSKAPKRKTLFQLAYAPPEFILNQLSCASQSSDVFSFCLVIYRLWSGHLPFHQSNPAILTQLQITYPITKPWEMKRKLGNILQKGLYKHAFNTSPNRMTEEKICEVLIYARDKRYPSFHQFALDVQQL